MTGQRGQTIHCLDIRNLHMTKSKATFLIGDLLKTSKPGQHLTEVTLMAYPADRRVCVITYLQDYLKRTKTLREQESHSTLFLSWKPPYKPVSRDTLRRWTRTVMNLAGINTTLFKPHSTRAASTSAATSANVPIDTIMKTAGWKKSSTFAKYYKKPIYKDTNTLYQKALLNPPK